MNLYPEYQNQMEREAVYRIRELFANGREASLTAMETSEEAYLCELAEAALYPEKPLLSFHTGEEENGKNQTGELVELFRLAHKLRGKRPLHRLIACGGVDDGKSTLIGRILFDAKAAENRRRYGRTRCICEKTGAWILLFWQERRRKRQTRELPYRFPTAYLSGKGTAF